MQLASFHGRLFGPGLSGAGVVVAGRWQDNVLKLAHHELSLEIQADDLEIEAAGFNLQQLRLSWRHHNDEFACFIENSADADSFLKHAPARLAALTRQVQAGRKRLQTRFRSALMVYGLILALPFCILAFFMLRADWIAGLVAEQVPVRYEEKIGNLILAQTRARARLIEQGPAYDTVTAIGNGLTRGSRYSYRWFIADNKAVNAFAAPGGVIVVYSGLIEQAGRAEELAGVLAHEVAHVEQRHALKSLVKTAGFGVVLSLVLGDWSGSALSGWIAQLTELKFSREAETDADSEGLRRMVEAGINPQYMAYFFARLAQEEDAVAKTLSILSTHPASSERMETLRSQIRMLPPREYDALNVDWEAVKASLEIAS